MRVFGDLNVGERFVSADAGFVHLEDPAGPVFEKVGSDTCRCVESNGNPLFEDGEEYFIGSDSAIYGEDA